MIRVRVYTLHHHRDGHREVGKRKVVRRRPRCPPLTPFSPRIAFDLPPPDTPLAAIRSSLAEYTHLAPDAFKLIHAGAVMKDDSAPSPSSSSQGGMT